MRAAIDRMNGFFPMKVLFALLGVLALLANIPPDKPQAGFFSASDLKLVYGVVKSDYAVIPELDRDKRQRSHPTVPFGDGQRLFAPAFLPLAGTPTLGTTPRPDSAPPRFHHLDQRTSPSRAPPTLS